MLLAPARLLRARQAGSRLAAERLCHQAHNPISLLSEGGAQASEHKLLRPAGWIRGRGLVPHTQDMQLEKCQCTKRFLQLPPQWDGLVTEGHLQQTPSRPGAISSCRSAPPWGAAGTALGQQMRAHLFQLSSWLLKDDK